MMKFSDNPPMLHPAELLNSASPFDWWVAQTKSRSEKAFVQDIARRGVGYFLPMIERVRISGGRKRKSMVPLFPGYVFFRGNAECRLIALQTDRLCQIIAVKDQAELHEELLALHRLLNSDKAFDWHRFAAVGARCHITRGPLQGLSGIVIQREKASSRVVLQVSILGQGAAVDIDADFLEPAL